MPGADKPGKTEIVRFRPVPLWGLILAWPVCGSIYWYLGVPLVPYLGFLVLPTLWERPWRMGAARRNCEISLVEHGVEVRRPGSDVILVLYENILHVENSWGSLVIEAGDQSISVYAWGVQIDGLIHAILQEVPKRLPQARMGERQPGDLLGDKAEELGLELLDKTGMRGQFDGHFIELTTEPDTRCVVDVGVPPGMGFFVHTDELWDLPAVQEKQRICERDGAKLITSRWDQVQLEYKAIALAEISTAQLLAAIGLARALGEAMTAKWRAPWVDWAASHGLEVHDRGLAVAGVMGGDTIELREVAVDQTRVTSVLSVFLAYELPKHTVIRAPEEGTAGTPLNDLIMDGRLAISGPNLKAVAARIQTDASRGLLLDLLLVAGVVVYANRVQLTVPGRISIENLDKWLPQLSELAAALDGENTRDRGAHP